MNDSTTTNSRKFPGAGEPGYGLKRGDHKSFAAALKAWGQRKENKAETEALARRTPRTARNTKGGRGV